MICTIVIIALLFIDLGANIAKHGESKTGEYNGWTTFVAVIIELVLFYGAGLFDKFGL